MEMDHVHTEAPGGSGLPSAVGNLREQQQLTHLVWMPGSTALGSQSA